jgi:hypothetical protein
VHPRAEADVISLASRRRLSMASPAPVPLEPVRRRPILALTIGAISLVLAIVAGGRSRSLAEIRALSSGDRARMFQRALDDMKTTCAGPERLDGALRDHCRAQAEFLMLFPECDRACQTMAATSLPHARR